MSVEHTSSRILSQPWITGSTSWRYRMGPATATRILRLILRGKGTGSLNISSVGRPGAYKVGEETDGFGDDPRRTWGRRLGASTFGSTSPCPAGAGKESAPTSPTVGKVARKHCRALT